MFLPDEGFLLLSSADTEICVFLESHLNNLGFLKQNKKMAENFKSDILSKNLSLIWLNTQDFFCFPDDSELLTIDLLIISSHAAANVSVLHSVTRPFLLHKSI